MKCPRCDSENMSFMVDIIVHAPIKYLHELSKTNLRKKDVEIIGADWDKATYVCLECYWDNNLDRENK